MKIEVTDAFGKLWEEAGDLDQETRRRGITVPVGLREVTPETREAFAFRAFQGFNTGLREAIQSHKDQRENREKALKAAEDAEKERIENEAKGRKKDSVGWYTPIPGTFSFVLPLPNDAEPQRRAIVDRLRQIRNQYGIKRTRVEEAGGYVRVQYVPTDEGQPADLNLINVVGAVRNGYAVDEKNRAEQRMAEQSDAERAREAEAEEARWASYASA